MLEFDFEREITNIWNAVIESYEGNHYVIRNAGYNANITAGQSVLFGFNGHGGSANNVAENCVLYSWEIDTTEYVELSDGKIEKIIWKEQYTQIYCYKVCRLIISGWRMITMKMV